MTTGPAGWRVSYEHHIEYEIVNCPHLLDPGNPGLLSVGRREQGARRFVVVDENVERLHAGTIRDYFDRNCIDARIVVFPGGEESKSVDGYLALLGELDSFPIDRRDEPVIGIGGGVLTDLVGFVAGTYRRGVSHLRVPTTLMGYVDASVGVKTAVNFHRHKNRVGAFAPPRKVLLDPAFLQTLPPRHILNGIGEMLKLAVIADLPLFELLEAQGAGCIQARFQDEAGARLLNRSVQRMVDELQPNLFEDCLARTMDFGHTFSLGLEMAPGSVWLHGEAVLVDVLVSTVLAANRGLMRAAEVERLFGLVRRLGIDLHPQQVAASMLWPAVEERTLHRDGLQRMPLPRGIGACVFANDVAQSEVEASCRQAVALLASAGDPA